MYPFDSGRPVGFIKNLHFIEYGKLSEVHTQFPTYKTKQYTATRLMQGIAIRKTHVIS